MIDINPLNLSSDLAPAGGKAKLTKKSWLIFFILILLGTATGYGLTKLRPGTGVKNLTRTASPEQLIKGGTFGVQDEKAFPDKAEGQLVQGGIDGEGSHHLVREGGESQNVYLTSSIIDLNQFVGKQVQVWGQTFKAQNAGWLMDVGRLTITE